MTAPERDTAPPGGGGAASAERLGEGRDVQPDGSSLTVPDVCANPAAAQALFKMQLAAAAAGMTLFAESLDEVLDDLRGAA